MIIQNIQAELLTSKDIKFNSAIQLYEGENNTTMLTITIPEQFRNLWIYVEYTNAIGESNTSARLDVVEGEIEFLIPYFLTKKAGYCYIQIIVRENENDDPILKSEIEQIRVLPSLNADDVIEEAHPDFITEAQKVVDNAEKTSDNAQIIADEAAQALLLVQEGLSSIDSKLTLAEQAKADAETASSIAGESANTSVTAKNAAELIRQAIVILENLTQQAKADAVSAKDVAVTAKNDAELIKQAVVTLESSTQQAKTEAVSSADSAEVAKEQAVQALADLLAMLGIDVATLVGGKIPLNQIPATAIHDIFTVSNENELTMCVAQKGDMAHIIVNNKITKTFQLLSDENNGAGNMENWVEFNTNYATTSGYASTAGEATNATMINNHRVVAMTQAQYDAAVKDPDTIYLVG